MKKLTATFEEMAKHVECHFPNFDRRKIIIPPSHIDHIDSHRHNIAGNMVVGVLHLSRDVDSVHSKVHRCLNKIRRQPTLQEAMVMMSQISLLMFENLLVSKLAKLSVTKPEGFQERGNQRNRIHEQKKRFSDILVVSDKRGLLVGVVQSVHFNDPKLAEEKLTESAARLRKGARNVQEVVGTVPGADYVAVHTTLVLPNITRTQLDNYLQNVQEVRSITCLCREEMDNEESLKHWWEACWSPPQLDVIDNKVYKILFTMFVYPAINVSIYPTTQRSLQIRHPHDLVNTVGDLHGATFGQEGLIQVSLTPAQAHLLGVDFMDDSRDDLKLLRGPPGTGKTILLVLRVLQWVTQYGARHIIILQTTEDGTAASCLVEYQLQQALNTQQQRARQSGTDTMSAQCTFTHVDLSGLRSLETNSKSDKKEVLKEKLKRFVTEKLSHRQSRASTDTIHIVADEANGNTTAAVYQWLKKEGVAIVRLWAAGMELFVDHESIPVSLQRALCHVTEPLRCPGPVVKEVMGARQIVEGKVPRYDESRLLTSVPLVSCLHHYPCGNDGHSRGDYPWQCNKCCMLLVGILQGLRVGEKSEGRSALSANDVFILSSRMSCDKPVDDVLSPAPLIKILNDNGYGVRTLNATSSRDDILSVIRADAKSPAITMANEKCVLGLEKKVVLYCDTAVNADLSGKLLAFPRTTSLLIIISSDYCKTDSKLPHTRDYFDFEHLDNIRDNRCMKYWRTREDKDEIDGWTPLHLACYYNWVDRVPSLISPRMPDLKKPGDVFSEEPVSTAKVDRPKQKTAAVNHYTDPGNPVSDSKDVTGSSPAPSSQETVTAQGDSSSGERVRCHMQYGYRCHIRYGYWASDIDVKTEDDETPLFVASSRGHAEIVKGLHERGANAKIRNKDGRSPKDIAALHGHWTVLKLLS